MAELRIEAEHHEGLNCTGERSKSDRGQSQTKGYPKAPVRENTKSTYVRNFGGDYRIRETRILTDGLEGPIKIKLERRKSSDLMPVPWSSQYQCTVAGVRSVRGARTVEAFSRVGEVSGTDITFRSC